MLGRAALWRLFFTLKKLDKDRKNKAGLKGRGVIDLILKDVKIWFNCCFDLVYFV